MSKQTENITFQKKNKSVRKKAAIVTLCLMVLIMFTDADVYTDDADVDIDGNPITITVSGNEKVISDVESDEKVYRLKIDWNTDADCCFKVSTYVWNDESGRYELQKTDVDVSQNNRIKTVIRITNYSNADVDYEIVFDPIQIADKEITYENPADSAVDKPYGRIVSADQHHDVLQKDQTNKSADATYHSIIHYYDDYQPAEPESTLMGEYIIRICRLITIDKTALTLKEGKSITLSSNVASSWSSSNSTVAKVKDGTVTALNAGEATISASTAAGRTISCEVTVVKKPIAYQLNDASQYLLILPESETVTYSFNNSSCIAYNGFIEESAYVTFSQAQTFIKELNGQGKNKEKILPHGEDDPNTGYWHLFESALEAQTWAKASQNENDDADSYCLSDGLSRFAGVSCLWSEVSANTNNAFYYNCYSGYWFKGIKDTSYYSYGFVAIWTYYNH